DDLVEGPDLGVEEAGELRVLLPIVVRLGETLLDLGQASGLDLVGPDLVDHAATPFVVWVRGDEAHSATVPAACQTRSPPPGPGARLAAPSQEATMPAPRITGQPSS